MNIQQIVSNASDRVMQKMVNEFTQNTSSQDEHSSNLNNPESEINSLAEDYKLMIKYCNYLVEEALEEYSKQSK